jgi:hypothetical protein
VPRGTTCWISGVAQRKSQGTVPPLVAAAAMAWLGYCPDEALHATYCMRAQVAQAAEARWCHDCATHVGYNAARPAYQSAALIGYGKHRESSVLWWPSVPKAPGTEARVLPAALPSRRAYAPQEVAGRAGQTSWCPRALRTPVSVGVRLP